MKEIKKTKQRESIVMPKKTWYYQDITSPHHDLQIQQTPIKIRGSYFVNIDKVIMKYIWKDDVRQLNMMSFVTSTFNNFASILGQKGAVGSREQTVN